MPALLIGLFLGLQAPNVFSVPLPVPDAKDIWVEALHNCENVNNIPRILDSNNKYSYGYVMFQMDTWLSYGKKFGATRENIGDDDLQHAVARDMLDKGGWGHWHTCSKRVSAKYGSYPSAS